MGWFGGLANVAGLQLANIEANPEQAAVGANTPESTYALNKTVAPTMDKHYTPTVNMMGGATQGEMQQNAAQGYSNTGPMAANAVGNAAAMYFTGGAATPLVAGQMGADYYAAKNPNSDFARQYNGTIVASNANVNAGINAQLDSGLNQGMAMTKYAKGGLAAVAHHLQSQGRGQDTHLVHMTSSELNAMQHLAKSRGGSLTINPKTGLPEAGFLSTALPMVLGAAAAMTGQEWAVPLAMAMSAGGEYAYTGSLTQGLMAGLGAWGGAGLAGGIAGLGADAAAAGEAAAVPEAVIPPTPGGGALPAPTALNNAATAAEDSAGYAGNNLNGAANQVMPQGTSPYSPTPSSAGSSSPFQQNMSNFGKGLTSGNLGSYAMDHMGQVAAVGLPLLSSATGLFGNKNSNPPGVSNQTNPMGMKTIPVDSNGKPIFNASLPTQPSPAYKAKYPNYVTNPYNPFETTGMAEGGMAVGGSAPMIGTPAANSTMDSSVGNNSMFPMSEMARSYYSTPTQMPVGTNQNNDGQMDGTIPGYGPQLDTNTGHMTNNFADGGLTLPYMQQQQNQPATANGFTPAGGGSTYGQGQFSPQTNPMPPTGLQQMNQMGLPPAQFAKGGMPMYSGADYGSMVRGAEEMQQGLQTATRRKVLDTPTPDVGIYQSDAETRNMDPLSAAYYHLSKNGAVLPKGLNGIQKPSSLGAISHTPAAQAAAEAQAKQSIAKDADSKDAKEGGLMAMAAGGDSHVYKPTYTNYQQTPFNIQQAMQSYNPQIAPAGLPTVMPQQSMPQSTGYKIDPLLMNGSPAWKVEQARIAAEQAAAEQAAAAAQPSYGGDGGGGGANGGLMPGALRYANGGQMPMDGHLGGYSDGGRLLRGPGDGVSDSIPATIGGRQPARLAEGEFVIPARIVSELGNGSTDAGAKRLYAMMDRIKAKRSKTKNIATDTKAYKYLPA